MLSTILGWMHLEKANWNRTRLLEVEIGFVSSPQPRRCSIYFLCTLQFYTYIYICILLYSYIFNDIYIYIIVYITYIVSPFICLPFWLPIWLVVSGSLDVSLHLSPFICLPVCLVLPGSTGMPLFGSLSGWWCPALWMSFLCFHFSLIICLLQFSQSICLPTILSPIIGLP